MFFRYSWWVETARKMVRSGELGTISHMLVRFNQPGIQRYIDEGSSWMLNRAEAGGGALLNLEFHGFDLCRYITGEEPKVVSAVTSHSMEAGGGRLRLRHSPHAQRHDLSQRGQLHVSDYGL